MRNKFAGTYIGTLSLNSGGTVPDTVSLNTYNYPLRYLLSSILDTFNHQIGISMEFSLSGVCFAYYQDPNVPAQMLDNLEMIDCGDATLSADQKTLTLVYHPVTFLGQLDFSKVYTFIGTKQ
jgi:hypothetical protein